MIERCHEEVTLALSRIERKLRESSPAVANQLVGWMGSLSSTGRAADYFTQRSLFPMLLLPVWMSGAARMSCDCEFHRDLQYSTINGYYFIRLIDNVMDDRAAMERQLLPFAALFHSEFQHVYQRYFEHSHPFWRWFDSLWLASANAVCGEVLKPNLELEDFREIAAKKMHAAKIPLVAVHYRSGQRTDLASWLQFTDRLVEWWQFFDDLMDWHNDFSRGARTYFLCEGDRRRRSTESVHEWVAREGFEWGIEVLLRWMRGLRESSVSLHESAVEAFLEDSTRHFRGMVDKTLSGLRALALLANAMERDRESL